MLNFPATWLAWNLPSHSRGGHNKGVVGTGYGHVGAQYQWDDNSISVSILTGSLKQRVTPSVVFYDVYV